MQAYYDHEPAVFEAVGNGSYLYRWDIQTVTDETTDEEGNTTSTTQWQCQEVAVYAPISANKITAAVIAETWDSDYEQKLVNEYNAGVLSVYDKTTAAEKKANYKAFLSARDTLKAQVDADCKTLGIK